MNGGANTTDASFDMEVRCQCCGKAIGGCGGGLFMMNGPFGLGRRGFLCSDCARGVRPARRSDGTRGAWKDD